MLLCALFVACGNVKECENHSWEELSNTATCTEAGELLKKCLVCGKEEKEYVPALGHDWDEETVVTQVKPTCTTTGEGVHTCKVCKTSEPFTMDMVPHQFKPDFDLTVVATCTKPGKRVQDCRVCKLHVEEDIPALGHDFTGQSVTIKDATCEDEGEIELKCRRANCDGEDGNIPAIKRQTTPALGHDWQTLTTLDKEPTFEAAGERSVHCNRCESTKDNEVIPKLEEGKNVQYKFRIARFNREIIQAGLNSIEISIKDDSGVEVAKSTRENFANGVMTVSLPPKHYTATITGLPAGYTAQSSYSISAGSVDKDLVVNASLRPASDVTNETSYRNGVGTVMHNYTFKDIRDGREVTLSQLLATKKMVLLNFFFVDCTACRGEMNGLLSAYNIYKQDAALVLLDVIGYDTPETITNNYINVFNVPASVYVVQDITPNSVKPDDPEAASYNNIYKKFGYTNAPQNVVVDKEGVIVYAEGGSTSEMKFRSIFAQYTSDGPTSGGASTSSEDVEVILLPEATIPAKREQ